MNDKKPLTSDFTVLHVPKLSASDVGYAVLAAGLSAIPVVGGPVTELMQLVGPPIERRRTTWMEGVTAELHRLASAGIDIEGLQSNDQFISAVMQATVIAQRTHRQEKLNALRNALLNIATGQAPDEALQSIFLNFVDVFTDWHIKLLRLAQHPTATGEMTELHQVLEHTYPQLKGHREVYDAVWSDLSSKALVSLQSVHGELSSHQTLVDKWTTPLGDLFLKFIAAPILKPKGY